MRHSFPAFATTTAVALLLVGSSSRADWLVTRQGDRIETKGPWTVRGRLIVFTAANGQLTSLRAEEIDLAASQIATSEALAPKVEAPKEAPRAVLRLTDDDVGHVDPDAPESTGDGAEGSDEAAAPAPAKPAGNAATQLTVASWEQTDEGPGVTIVGRLANPTDSTATALTLQVVAFDADGRQVARGNASISATALPSGQDAEFKITFSEISRFTSVRFEPEATLFKANPTPPPSGASEAPPAATPAPDAAPESETSAEGDGGSGS